MSCFKTCKRRGHTPDDAECFQPIQKVASREALEQSAYFIVPSNKVEASNQMGRPVSACISEMGWNEVIDTIM